MNRIIIPKRTAKKRTIREDRRPQLELTLELPRDSAPARETPDAEKVERGIAVVDFFI